MALPLADEVASRLRREVERTAVRARNGLRYATGTEWAPVSPTPRDGVWRQGPATLWRYRNEHVTVGPPLLLFIGLVSRSWILDLHEDASLVAALCEAGFDVYVLDWGEPGPEDATNTLETYVLRYLPRAMAALLRESRADDASVLGYCMGGNMALLAVAAQPDLPVRNLVTMATAIDLTALPGLAGAVQQRDLDPPTSAPRFLISSFFSDTTRCLTSASRLSAGGEVTPSSERFLTDENKPSRRIGKRNGPAVSPIAPKQPSRVK